MTLRSVGLRPPLLRFRIKRSENSRSINMLKGPIGSLGNLINYALYLLIHLYSQFLSEVSCDHWSRTNREKCSITTIRSHLLGELPDYPHSNYHSVPRSHVSTLFHSTQHARRCQLIPPHSSRELIFNVDTFNTMVKNEEECRMYKWWFEFCANDTDFFQILQWLIIQTFMMTHFWDANSDAIEQLLRCNNWKN